MAGSGTPLGGPPLTKTTKKAMAAQYDNATLIGRVPGDQEPYDPNASVTCAVAKRDGDHRTYSRGTRPAVHPVADRDFLHSIANQRLRDFQRDQRHPVLAKVLPKFHGARSKLETPLKVLLAWCRDPQSPNVANIEQLLQGKHTADEMVAVLSDGQYHFPRTAQRALAMLHDLYTEGFAAFG